MSGRVVNIRDLGRVGVWPKDVRRIDRRGPFGNPFGIGQVAAPWSEPADWFAFTRLGAIEAYRSWLERRLKVEPDFLEPLRGKRLACWCAPLPCHGDVIAELVP